jgi:hypothetical protein
MTDSNIDLCTLKFSHFGSSSAHIIESELGFTDLLNTLLNFGNENICRSFRLTVCTLKYGGEC